jgi:hypothetical protein
VLHHSGPTFGQVLYSCQDAFVVDASEYSVHLIRHLLGASEAFPTEWFLQFWEQVKGWWAHVGLYGGWGSTCHPYFSKISDTAPEAWGRALMYDRWSLREIWLQSVSSCISRLHFAEQGPRILPIRTHCTLLTSASKLSRKSERLHHPTGRASAVCRTFEMTEVLLDRKIPEHLKCAPQLMKQALIIPLTTSRNVFALNLWQQEEAKHNKCSPNCHNEW